MIIDTSVIIGAVERRDPQAIEQLEQLEQPSVRSMAVLGELAFGIESADARVATLRHRSKDLYLAITDPNTLSAVDGSLLARWFGAVSAIARTDGIRIGQNDRWIVAEALTHSVPVWTCDETMAKLVHSVRQRHDLPAPVLILPAS